MRADAESIITLRLSRPLHMRLLRAAGQCQQSMNRFCIEQLENFVRHSGDAEFEVGQCAKCKRFVTLPCVSCQVKESVSASS